MRRRSAIAGLGCALFLLAVPCPAGAEPLPGDPSVHRAKLPNGVTWMYRQHANPPGKMALMVHVASGSLNETESQRGLAHFLEHMCFNGTEHFAPGELLKYYESIGMEFGADLNAFTSFDQTAYMLFLPSADGPQVDKALMTLSDYVFRAELSQEEIDKERNVVLEEWRSRKSAWERIQEKQMDLVFAGTRLPKRLTIGLPEVIKNADRSEFVDYYRTWYRPSNITVMLVGDAAPEAFVASIEKWFGSYKSEYPVRQAYDAGIEEFTETRAFVITDPELAGCDVELIHVRAGRQPRTTVEQYREDLLIDLAVWIVDRRLEERVQSGVASYRRASVGLMSFIKSAWMAIGTAAGEPADWSRMLEELIEELLRVREHGFTRPELDLARKDLLAAAREAVERESTRPARRVLMSLNSAVNRGEPIMSAEQRFELSGRLLPEVSPSEVHAAFNRHFGAEHFTYVVTMPDKPDVTVPTEEDVLERVKAALAVRPAAPKEVGAPATILAGDPKPGKVEEKSVETSLHITSAWLSNGVRVHHRFMDYKKDLVIVSIKLAGGQIEEREGNFGVTRMVASALRNQPATDRLTSTQIQDIMTGRNIAVSANAERDALSLSVRGSPADLESGLQLSHALLTAGRIEESALRVWQQQQSQLIAMFENLPRAKAYEALAESVYGGDPRLQRQLNQEQVDAITLEKAQAWFESMRRDAPIEVAVVGEIKVERALELAQRYFASLPVRPRRAAHLDPLRSVARSDGPFEHEVSVPTISPKGVAIAGFMGSDALNVYDTRALDLASNILTSRLILRVREELALVYSLRAGNRPGIAYPDCGMFVTQAPCDPANADSVVREAHGIFADFAESGPTSAEMINAVKQVENNLDELMREPRFWLDVLGDLDYHGKRLEDVKAEATAYRAYGAEDVKRVFRKYYVPKRRFSVTAVPATLAADEPAKRGAG